MLEEINIEFKFKEGDEVVQKGSDLRGTIVRQWSTMSKVSASQYVLVKSYTVKPPKAQRVKLLESQLNKVTIGDDGIAF